MSVTSSYQNASAHSRKSTFLLLALVLAISVILVGCAGEEGRATEEGRAAAEPVFMDYYGMKQEYLQKVATYPFPLPEGVSFPSEPRRPTEPTSFQRGFGVIEADVFWKCAWMFEWVEHRETDPERAVVAMYWLKRFPESDFIQKHVSPPGDATGWLNALDRAQLGDLTGFQNLMRHCPESAR